MKIRHSLLGLVAVTALLVALLPAHIASQVFPGIALYGRFNSLAKALTATTDGYLNVKIAGGGGTFTAATTVSISGLATTPADGVILTNPTAATALATVQMPPRFRQRGFAWTGAASQSLDWTQDFLPVSAATPTSTYLWKHALNGAAYTTPMTLTSAGALAVLSGGTFGSTSSIVNGALNAVQLSWAGSGATTSGWTKYFYNNVATFVIGAVDVTTGHGLITNGTLTAGVGVDIATDATFKVRTRSFADTAVVDVNTLVTSGKYTTYNNVVTAGWGVPAVYGYGDVAAATNTGTASIATYTVGAADGTFEVSANCLVTTSTTHSFSLDVTYTDESNSARTLVLPVAQLAGSFVASGLITNITGAGPYESPTMTIRAKAATAITVRTSAGGTYTTVIYNARGVIKQVA